MTDLGVKPEIEAFDTGHLWFARQLVTEGILEGHIAFEPSGENGFGYDPVFHVPAAGKTAAEMDRAEKNSISHRYRALVEMKALLDRDGEPLD